MLPLTQSLYVPGKVASGGTVLVDIGTGYYAEKSLPSATDMIDRKFKLVNENVDAMEKVRKQKEQNLEAIMGVMQQKIYMIEQKRAETRAAMKEE